MNMCFSKEPAPAEIEVCELGRPLSSRSWGGAPGLSLLEAGRGSQVHPLGPRRGQKFQLRLTQTCSGSKGMQWSERVSQVTPTALEPRLQLCPRQAPAQHPPLNPPHPVLRVPVMQENVWNPLKPQLCFFLSPIFHLMGLAGCHFCASANSVLRCERLGRQAGLPPGQSAVGAPGRRRLPGADVGGPVRG